MNSSEIIAFLIVGVGWLAVAYWGMYRFFKTTFVDKKQSWQSKNPSLTSYLIDMAFLVISFFAAYSLVLKPQILDIFSTGDLKDKIIMFLAWLCIYAVGMPVFNFFVPYFGNGFQFMFRLLIAYMYLVISVVLIFTNQSTSNAYAQLGGVSRWGFAVLFPFELGITARKFYDYWKNRRSVQNQADLVKIK